MSLLYSAFHHIAAYLPGLVFIAFFFGRNRLSPITLPPAHPLSFERTRRFAQCDHRLSFNGCAFVQARPA